MLLSGGLGLGPDEVGQKDLKLLHLRRHSQKNLKPQNFYSLQTQSCWVFWGFEQLSSDFDTRDIPTQRHVHTAGLS